MGARGCSASTSTSGPGARARRTPRGRWTQPCPCCRSMRPRGSGGHRWWMAPEGGGRCSGSRWTDDRTEDARREAGRAALCGAEGLKHALLVVLAALLALPAEARVRKKRKRHAPEATRAADDPRRRGDTPAVARSSIAFVAPRGLAELDKSAVSVPVQITGQAI